MARRGRRNRVSLGTMLRNIAGNKLTDEEVEEIVERTDLKSKDLKVINDPFEFEEASREVNYTFKHSWAGEINDTTEATTIFGDCEVGYEDIYEYSFNGGPIEKDEDMDFGDFSVNNVSLVEIKRDYSDRFNKSNSRDYQESSERYLLMYIPEEEYPVESFRELKNREELLRKLEEAQKESQILDGKLNEKDSQIQDN